MVSEYLLEKEKFEKNMGTYKELMLSMLKKYKVDSPKELSKEDRKKFYNEIDSMWKSKDEKSQNLKEAFEFWKIDNKTKLNEQHNNKNINKDAYDKLLFETFITTGKVYDIDYPMDYETFKDLNVDKLRKMYANLDDVSKGGRSFEQFVFDDYNTQLLPNFIFIDAKDVQVK